MATVRDGTDSYTGEQRVETRTGTVLQQSREITEIGAGNIQGSSRSRGTCRFLRASGET